MFEWGYHPLPLPPTPATTKVLYIAGGVTLFWILIATPGEISALKAILKYSNDMHRIDQSGIDLKKKHMIPSFQNLLKYIYIK